MLKTIAISVVTLIIRYFSKANGSSEPIRQQHANVNVKITSVIVFFEKRSL